ncbi:hypothetical protein DFH09DRAFT_1081740 [Mycena vulgaris]|nr:hypothetical protein DFH09DRAFT_1081740 [Mycena vulgaris]
MSGARCAAFERLEVGLRCPRGKNKSRSLLLSASELERKARSFVGSFVYGTKRTKQKLRYGNEERAPFEVGLRFEANWVGGPAVCIILGVVRRALVSEVWCAQGMPDGVWRVGWDWVGWERRRGGVCFGLKTWMNRDGSPGADDGTRVSKDRAEFRFGFVRKEATVARGAGFANGYAEEGADRRGAVG